MSVCKEDGTEYFIEDFASIVITQDNDIDGGVGIIDVAFYAEGDGAEIQHEQYNQSDNADTFIDDFSHSYGLGDWMDMMKSCNMD